MSLSLKSQRMAIKNAVIFDGLNAELVEGTILCANGVIESVGESPGEVDETVDARGGVVMPGMIDAHFHAYGVSLDFLRLEALPKSLVALMGRDRLVGAVQRGFTTVRDVAGGDPGLASAIEQGMFPAPRYHYTGAALSQTGGHGDARPGDLDLCCGGHHVAEVVDGVDNLRAAVRERFRQGAHAIKIMTSGGVVSLTDPIRVPQYSDEEIRAVTEEANRRGSYVAAHSYSPESIVHSVINGVRSIEHGNLLDAESAAAMAQHRAYLVPTLAAYDSMERRGSDLGLPKVSQQKNREVLEAGKHAIAIAQDHDVRIGFGTDLMGPLEDDQLSGLRLQAEVMEPIDLLRSITSVNAELLMRSDIGRIMPGAKADFLILAGNPIERPALLWAGSRVVISGGQVVVDTREDS